MAQDLMPPVEKPLQQAKATRLSLAPKVRRGRQVRDTGAKFERYSQHPNHQVMPLGAFSYSLSGFSPCTRLGRFCPIGWSVSVFGDHHPTDRLSTSPIFYKRRRFKKMTGTAPSGDMVGFANAPHAVTIGHDVWIGSDVTLRDGIHIGDGAVIAACSVVTKDVAPYAIVAGNPARQIRTRFPQEIVEALLALPWWQYDVHAVQALPTDNVEQFLKEATALDASLIVPEDRVTFADLMA